MLKAKVLIVVDEISAIQALSRPLSRDGHSVDSVLSLKEAVAKLDTTQYDVVFIDLKLAGDGGGDLLERLRDAYPGTAVVILHGLVSFAASAALGYGGYEYLPKPVKGDSFSLVMNRVLLGYGGFEYLPKPVDGDSLSLVMNRVLQRKELSLETERVSQDRTVSQFEELVGHGPVMKALLNLISRVAETGSAVLLIGQVGTGKRLVAEAIHKLSPRNYEPFKVVDTTHKDRDLLSTIIFGQEFQIGRHSEFEPGVIEQAGAGTVFINEITALDEWAQVQMATAIRERHYLAVNGAIQRMVTCRFILASSLDVKKADDSGELRDELYRQVKVYPIYLPSLAERSEDIEALSHLFMRRFADRFDKNIVNLDSRLLTRLMARPWTHNMRELERCIERMVAVCEGETLTLEHYRVAMEDSGIRHWNIKAPVDVESLKKAKKQLRSRVVHEVERAFVIDALHRSDGNVTHAAVETGMQRRNFQALMRKYGIKAG